jgi:hypothetical protein
MSNYQEQRTKWTNDFFQQSEHLELKARIDALEKKIDLLVETIMNAPSELNYFPSEDAKKIVSDPIASGTKSLNQRSYTFKYPPSP